MESASNTLKIWWYCPETTCWRSGSGRDQLCKSGSCRRYGCLRRVACSLNSISAVLPGRCCGGYLHWRIITERTNLHVITRTYLVRRMTLPARTITSPLQQAETEEWPA